MVANIQRPRTETNGTADFQVHYLPRPRLPKITSMLPLLLLWLLLRRRRPHQRSADHRPVSPIRVVRIRLRVNRHFAVVRHRPCGPALSPGRVLHGFAVGSQGCVPQEDVLVWDGVAFGDAVAFAVGDGAVEGVWVGV